MTKKLAELSGSISVLSASMILVLAFLISHVSMPEIRVLSSHSASLTVSTESEAAESDQELTPISRIPAKSEISLKLNDVFAAPAAALSNSTLGLKQSNTETARQAISSVLAVSQSVPNFAVTASVSPEEYEMMLFCVGHETRSGSLAHKVLITEVILNRVQGPKFGSTVRDVVLAPGQFDVMVGYQGWGDWTPDETTLQAVNLVLSGSAPDYSESAVYFCNPYLVGEGNWFDMTREAVCELEGHRFYR